MIYFVYQIVNESPLSVVIVTETIFGKRIHYGGVERKEKFKERKRIRRRSLNTE